MSWSRNRRYRHIFVVLRVDASAPGGGPTGSAVAATKAFWCREAAEAESARLNRLNADKGVSYFYATARLVENDDAGNQ